MTDLEVAVKENKYNPAFHFKAIFSEFCFGNNAEAPCVMKCSNKKSQLSIFIEKKDAFMLFEILERFMTGAF